MKIIEQDTATISFDMEGDACFLVGETIHYLNEFLKTSSGDFDGVSHITNAGGMGIKINEAEETVDYTIFTI